MENDNKEILLISVIVPVFNSSKYLARCIHSILNQTHADIELLLVNDGSTDDSAEICDDFAKKNDKVRVFHTLNKGVSSARNLGLDNCKGDFVFFIDSDDYLEVDAIQALIEGYKNSQSEIIIGAFCKVTSTEVLIAKLSDFEQDSLLSKKELMDYTIQYLRNPRKNQLLMSCWAKLFKTSIIKQNEIHFDPNLKIAEDVAFNFAYLKHINTAFFIKKVVYNQQKMQNYNSLSMKLPDNPRDLFGYIDALASIEKLLLYNNPKLEIKRDIGLCYVYQIILSMVRLSGQVNSENKGKLYRFVKELLNDPDFRMHITRYTPAKGNYRLIPLLMKYRLPWLLIFVCRREAQRLYN